MTMQQEQEFSKRFDLGLWAKLLKYAAPYKKWMGFLGFVMVCVAGIDVVFPLMTKYAIDNFAVTHSLNGIQYFALGYLALVIIQSVNAYGLISIAGKIEMGICYDIRKHGFKRLQELSFSYYDKTAVGWIMARMTSDIARLSDTMAWGLGLCLGCNHDDRDCLRHAGYKLEAGTALFGCNAYSGAAKCVFPAEDTEGVQSSKKNELENYGSLQ
jgi:ABC-type multidrug transport system fused ATPase/permease subunit